MKWRRMGLLTQETAELNKDSPVFFTNPRTQDEYPHLGFYLMERDQEYPHKTLMTTEEEERCHEFIVKEYIELTQ